jgi:hypothetical protein
MNLKIFFFLVVLGASSIATASAQSLFAGWDFSQFSGSGFNSTNGTDFTGEGNVQANYSDFLSPSPDIAASSFGSIYYNGTNGSSNAANGSFADISPFTGSLNSVSNQTSDGNPFNDSSSYAVLGDSGQTFTNDLLLAVDGNFAIVFEANVFGQGVGANTWQLNFAAQDTTNASTIGWGVSADGANYTSLGLTSSLTGADSGFSVIAGSAFDGEDQVFFRGTFAGVDTRALIDNVGIGGTIVPEPSTYAVIFGSLALTIAVYRRRRA